MYILQNIISLTYGFTTAGLSQQQRIFNDDRNKFAFLFVITEVIYPLILYSSISVVVFLPYCMWRFLLFCDVYCGLSCQLIQLPFLACCALFVIGSCSFFLFQCMFFLIKISIGSSAIVVLVLLSQTVVRACITSLILLHSQVAEFQTFSLKKSMLVKCLIFFFNGGGGL